MREAYTLLLVCTRKTGDVRFMGALLEHKARTIFVTASSVKKNGKAREIVVESRPQYAVVQLNGTQERYSIAWEVIYELAKKKHAQNLRIEARAAGNYAKIERRKAPN